VRFSCSDCHGPAHVPTTIVVTRGGNFAPNGLVELIAARHNEGRQASRDECWCVRRNGPGSRPGHLFGLGTRALPSWEWKTRWTNLWRDLAAPKADMRDLTAICPLRAKL